VVVVTVGSRKKMKVTRDINNNNNNNNNNTEHYKYASSSDPKGHSPEVLESYSPPRLESNFASGNPIISVNIIILHTSLFEIHINLLKPTGNFTCQTV
jgi:hypothetical protein